jgi:hypothetical protein
MAWKVDLTQYLDSEGRIAANLPAPVWSRARYFGAITIAACIMMTDCSKI